MASNRDAFGRFKGRGRSGGRPIKSATQLSSLLEQGISFTSGRIILRCMQTLPSATPVDKGTARSGWTPSVGSAVDERIDAPSDDDQAKKEAAARASKNFDKAQEIAETYHIRQGKAFIANPVPWIVPLNEGSSSQAADKFAERAIDEALRSIK